MPGGCQHLAGDDAVNLVVLDQKNAFRTWGYGQFALFIMGLRRFHLFNWEADAKCAADTGFALNLDFAAQCLHETPRDSQS